MTHPFIEAFTKRVNERRYLRREIAATAGVTTTAITRWENDESEPSLMNIEACLATVGLRLVLEECPALVQPDTRARRFRFKRDDIPPGTGVALSESQRREIRRLYSTGLYTMDELGARFSSSRSRIWQIVRRQDKANDQAQGLAWDTHKPARLFDE